MNQYRHGEILLQQVDTIPEGAVLKQTNVVATGKTGHDHILTGGTILETPAGDIYLDITGEGAAIDHMAPPEEKHNKISLGVDEKYQIIRQREHDPYANAARQVED